VLIIITLGKGGDNIMSFSENTIQAVWEKGNVVPGNNSDVWRKDQCSAWLHRDSHGNRKSQYGWEINHIDPNGSDNLSNLRPLQWENNAEKSDGKLACPIIAVGTNNTRR
jgi:hypothetical protein